MVTFTSKEAKDRFGEMVDAAKREPVTITKHNRPSVVVLSADRYAELEALEDQIWAKRADAAFAEGGIGTEESQKLLISALNAED